jgi:hypothetical protein
MIRPSALPLDRERARRVVRSFAAPAPTNDALDCELLQDIAEGLVRSVSAGQLPPGRERRWIRLLGEGRSKSTTSHPARPVASLPGGWAPVTRRRSTRHTSTPCTTRATSKP